MPKYLILYKSSLSASELMDQATPEEMKASMAEWMQWKEELDQSIGFEWGMPLQPRSEITPTSTKESNSTVSGYSIMEGDYNSILESLNTHPHLKRKGASIDVIEMLSMPGQ